MGSFDLCRQSLQESKAGKNRESGICENLFLTELKLTRKIRKGDLKA